MLTIKDRAVMKELAIATYMFNICMTMSTLKIQLRKYRSSNAPDIMNY